MGAGFGGLWAARGLSHEPVGVTLLDRNNYHTFFPLLYQVATGILSEGEIAPATREVLRRQENARVVLGEVVDIDAGCVRVTDAEGNAIERSTEEVTGDADAAEKGGYEAFMLKEIHEQADAVAETIADRTVRPDGVDLPELDDDLLQMPPIAFDQDRLPLDLFDELDAAPRQFRPQFARAAARRQRLCARMTALHALQDQIVAGLDRQMQMREQTRLLGD